MTGWIIGIVIGSIVLQQLGRYSLFRLIVAIIWAPICGYGLYYCGVFFWAVAMGIYDTSAYYAKYYDTFHKLMSWDGLYNPIAIGFVIFFFIGFLNPRLYGQR